MTASGDPGAMRIASHMFGQATMIGVAMTLGGVTCLAIFAYLLESLYAERKDRSILFWKSLPVSDAQTVLAKLAVALLVTPLLALLLSALIQPLITGALFVRYEHAREVIGGGTLLGGLRTLPKIAMVWLYGVLWYSPFVAWLMLASVLAKRVPLMYALMPPVTLMLLEWMFLDTNHLARFLGERLAPWTRSDWAWNGSDPQRGLLPGLGSPDWPVLFTNGSLWLGVAAAAAMVYLVIRLRRYRDDT
jgi:ABC-2 type transport system permease protein